MNRKEAIETLRRCMPRVAESQCDFEIALRVLVPELKDSEDERIRKEIIAWLKSGEGQTLPIDRYNAALAWLERQAEHANFRNKIQIGDKVTRNPDGVLVNLSQLNRVAKQGEQKPADKVEPKFKVGDWVVFNDKHDSIYQVKNIKNCQYTLKHTLGGLMPLSFSSETMIRRWTIEHDAKDGDVICYEDEVSIYKHDIKECTKQETRFGGFVYHCCYDGKRFITDSLYSLIEQDKSNIHPATKQQRELLFQKIKEAGYEWDAKKKELKKIEQKPAEWREEDEAGLGNALWAIQQASTIAKNENDMGKLWYAERWLKSLRPQNQWKPTKEQMTLDAYGGSVIKQLADAKKEVYEH